jgi:hypothetical protein
VPLDQLRTMERMEAPIDVGASGLDQEPRLFRAITVA